MVAQPTSEPEIPTAFADLREDLARTIPMTLQAASNSAYFTQAEQRQVQALLSWLELVSELIGLLRPRNIAVNDTLKSAISESVAIREAIPPIEQFFTSWVFNTGKPITSREVPDTISVRVFFEHCKNLMGKLNVLGELLLEFIEPLEDFAGTQYSSLSGRAANLSARSSANRVREIEKDVAEAAGVVGTSTLAKWFDTYHEEQAKRARSWFILAALLLIVVALIGGLLLNGSSFVWQQTVAHLVIALPVAGAAAYSARESSRHRESAQWARVVAVQIKTIGPYAERLNETNRESLWVNFGTYIFGPRVITLNSDNQLHTIPPEIANAFANLVKASK